MNNSVDASDFIVDIREYDVPYHVRVMIDLGRFGEQVYYLGFFFADLVQISELVAGTSLKPSTALPRSHLMRAGRCLRNQWFSLLILRQRKCR